MTLYKKIFSGTFVKSNYCHNKTIQNLVPIHLSFLCFELLFYVDVMFSSVSIKTTKHNILNYIILVKIDNVLIIYCKSRVENIM